MEILLGSPKWAGHSIQQKSTDSLGYDSEITSGVLDLSYDYPSRLVPMEVKVSVLHGLRKAPMDQRGPTFISITVLEKEGVGLRHPGIVPGNGKITAEIVREAAERMRNPIIRPVSPGQLGKSTAYIESEINSKGRWKLGMSMSPRCILSQWIGFNPYEWRDEPGRNALGEVLPYWVSDWSRQAQKVVKFLASFTRFAQ